MEALHALEKRFRISFITLLNATLSGMNYSFHHQRYQIHRSPRTRPREISHVGFLKNAAGWSARSGLVRRAARTPNELLRNLDMPLYEILDLYRFGCGLAFLLFSRQQPERPRFCHRRALFVTAIRSFGSIKTGKTFSRSSRLFSFRGHLCAVGCDKSFTRSLQQRPR